MNLLVFTHRQTPRVEYIFRQIFAKMLNLSFTITQSESEFNAFSGPKLAYSANHYPNALNILPCNLLFETTIEKQNLALFRWRELPAFYAVNDTSDIPFDLFAASFFLITRYEEYLPFKADEHGRFPASESYANRMGFLQMPLVDLWVSELAKLLKAKFPAISIQPNKFEFIPTIDIDNAYAYKHKGILRAFLGTGKALVHFKLSEVFQRILVYLNLSRDPYNTYAKLFRTLSHISNSKWFILAGSYGENDKNLPVYGKAMRMLLARIGNHFELGIHPSYQSGQNSAKIAVELKALESVLNEKVIYSRQHFLAFTFPNYFVELNNLGVKSDFSLGYSSYLGYRASTCTPFIFYNLKTNEELALEMVPFSVMDRALWVKFQERANEAVELTVTMAKQVAILGGTFVLAWHNETLSGINEWKGWESVFDRIVRTTKGL